METINIKLSFDNSLNLGFKTKEWITLYGFCKCIGIYSNGTIFVKPEATQFYFDPDNELLFIRNTRGKPIESSINEELTPDYVKIQLKDKYYKLKLVEGGVVDSQIGRYHDVVSIDNITGFFN